MSPATDVLNANRLVEQLCHDGVPKAQAYALVRLAADVRHPGFDRKIAHQDLMTVGFTPARADKLIEGAARGSAEPPTRAWWHW
jgi:hypothetical protein